MLTKSSKILVIDDSQSMRSQVRGMMKQMGFWNIDDAEDGEVALRMLRQNDYDLILSDWNMPNMTGFELLNVVKGDPNLKNIPFVMITAESDKQSVVEALRLGVNSYVVKPFSAATLEERINQAIKKK